MIKLFEENSYIKEFESQIINLDKEKKLIELRKDCFLWKRWWTTWRFRNINYRIRNY